MDSLPFLSRLRHEGLRPIAVGLIIFFLLSTILYGLLFSVLGNRIITPIITFMLSKTLDTPVTIDAFTLKNDFYSLQLHDASHNTLTIHGSYSLTRFTTHGNYAFKAKNAGGINPLPSSLITTGHFDGSYHLLQINGGLATMGMDSDYTIGLKSLVPDTLKIDVRNLPANALLQTLDYPSHSISYLYGQANLSGLAKRKIKGNIRLWNKTDSFIASPIQEEDSNLSLDLYDWLADEDGKVEPFNIDCNLQLDLDEIGVLEQLIGYPLRGAVSLTSHVQGDKKNLLFKFHSTLANSNTHAAVEYKDLLPYTINYTISHAHMDQLFRFFNLTPPITGILNTSGKFGPKTGTMQLHLHHASTRPDVLKTEYNITQPYIRFNAKFKADIASDAIHYSGSFKSDLKRLQIDSNTTSYKILGELLKTIS